MTPPKIVPLVIETAFSQFVQSILCLAVSQYFFDWQCGQI